VAGPLGTETMTPEVVGAVTLGGVLLPDGSEVLGAGAAKTGTGAGAGTSTGAGTCAGEGICAGEGAGVVT
jgi:hypothetical protein